MTIIKIILEIECDDETQPVARSMRTLDQTLLAAVLRQAQDVVQIVTTGPVPKVTARLEGEVCFQCGRNPARGGTGQGSALCECCFNPQ